MLIPKFFPKFHESVAKIIQLEKSGKVWKQTRNQLISKFCQRTVSRSTTQIKKSVSRWRNSSNRGRWKNVAQMYYPMQHNFVFVLAYVTVSNLIKLVFICICKFHGFDLRVEVSRLLITSLFWFIRLNLKSFWQNPPRKVTSLIAFKRQKRPNLHPCESLVRRAKGLVI